MSVVQCRTVRRWYWGGKGYASSVRAYRAAAIRILKDELFCEVNFWDLSDRERLELIGQIYAKKFPHDEGLKCADRLALGSKACWLRNKDGEFYTPWCRIAKEEWIENKIAELRARDELEQAP